jgi:DNA end-binding protein Ku
MAPHSCWKGYLKPSLASCPVQMMTATSDGGRVRFPRLNRKTGNPVVGRYVDAVTEKPTAPTDQAGGCPCAQGDCLVPEEDEPDPDALDGTRMIDIEPFVPDMAINRVWLDRPYYLMPSDPVRQEAFAVIVQAMKAAGRVGISRLVIGGANGRSCFRPMARGSCCGRCAFGDEVRKPDEAFEKIRNDNPSPKLMKMVGTLVDRMTGDRTPDLPKDAVQDHLRQIIAAKKKTGRKPSATGAARAPQPKGNAVGIMDAPRKSTDSEKCR